MFQNQQIQSSCFCEGDYRCLDHRTLADVETRIYQEETGNYCRNCTVDPTAKFHTFDDCYDGSEGGLHCTSCMIEFQQAPRKVS